MESRFACTFASSLRSLLNPGRELKASVPNLRFINFHLIIYSYEYNMHIGSLLPANLCLVTLLSSEQCSQFERFRPQDVQMLNPNKSSNFKTKLTGNTVETSRVNCDIH